MLYDDQALQSGKTAQHRWPRDFNADDVFKTSPAQAGVLLEGVYRSHEAHLIDDKQRRQYRYRALHIEMTNAQRRRWDKFGQEIESNLVSSKKMNTGFLNSSYKKVESGGEDCLRYDDAVKVFQTGSEVDSWPGATHAHCVVLWWEEEHARSVEIDFGQKVRVRTRGEGPLIESLTVLDTDLKRAVGNYSGGERVGSSWTDKLMAAKSKTEGPTESERNEGVDDDEWDD